MPSAISEIPGIERENAQNVTSTGRRPSPIANGPDGACDSGFNPIRNPRRTDEHALILECRSCAARWLSLPEADGEFAQGFWRCPRGCDWR
jgi:hypothetical protein